MAESVRVASLLADVVFSVLDGNLLIIVPLKGVMQFLGDFPRHIGSDLKVTLSIGVNGYIGLICRELSFRSRWVGVIVN